ncbi:aromatic-L-amino-acid decarboxylase isoform X2 [Vanessa cardui]|uniref:aromatic-L-amino-acid decarboxylase isoform X2 n=1 Tax=Vanessa cardui TaxID=171605 RepID=UPI001F135749|nr:aromatic-L-amino-acid decarboxylase isoform X2 [Vanessa cardui]
MDHKEFRVKAKEMVDYIADYLENIRDHRVYPGVQPGYLHKRLPTEAPQLPEKWDDIFKDVEDHIMPGIVHWQSPHMHAYFPALTSYPSIMGEMLSSALNVLCFTWASSPAGTELETIAMNWLGKLLGLPECFLNEKNDSPGGGVIQTTASEATLVSLLAARTRALMELASLNPDLQSSELLGHLICYCSDQAHSSVEKAGLIGLVRMRYIESDENQCMRGAKLEEAILNDKAKGLVPFWVCATLGTTGSVAFDNLREIGEVCEKHSAWLHVDAAYAGSCFICPEYRHWLDGVELADSFAFNPSKWLMVNFDCTAMWVRDSTALHRTFNVNPIYLRHENSGKAIDYMHWQIPLSRRFRALKLWFVLRNYGVVGLQKHIRESVRLAQKFEALVLADQRFDIPQPRNLGMVVFRLKGDNNLTERLLKKLNGRGYIHAVPACFKGVYVIRFTVTSQRTTNQDILDDWNEIKKVASEILVDMFGSENGNIVIHKKPRISLKETRELNATFGTSLLLANSPMSPKIVNGTHVAICDYEQVLSSCAQTFAQLKMEPKDSPEMRRRVRGIRMCGKKFSLDSYMDMVQGLMVEQSLPQCSEEERDDASNGSSPGEKSSLSTSPATSSMMIKNDSSLDMNQLQVPATPSRQYRSKSIDLSLSDLKLDEATVSIDMKNNEIIITPTGSKKIDQVRFNAADEKLNIGDRINQAFENFQSSLRDNHNENNDSIDDKVDDHSKLTIKGPGSYIKKLIQQFSEGPFESDEPKADIDKAVSTPSIKDRADAICKKCFHYKGKMNN